MKPLVAYRSEFAGIVGSMETMALSVVSREMVVFLEDTPRQCLHPGRCPWGAPSKGPHSREEPGSPRLGLTLQTRGSVCK